jgi:hypothetical protein
VVLHVKYHPFFLSDFNKTWISSKYLRKLLIVKICPVNTELYHADRRSNGRTDMKLILVFNDFINAPNNCCYKRQNVVPTSYAIQHRFESLQGPFYVSVRSTRHECYMLTVKPATVRQFRQQVAYGTRHDTTGHGRASINSRLGEPVKSFAIWKRK